MPKTVLSWTPVSNNRCEINHVRIFNLIYPQFIKFILKSCYAEKKKYLWLREKQSVSEHIFKHFSRTVLLNHILEYCKVITKTCLDIYNLTLDVIIIFYAASDLGKLLSELFRVVNPNISVKDLREKVAIIYSKKSRNELVNNSSVSGLSGSKTNTYWLTKPNTTQEVRCL